MNAQLLMLLANGGARTVQVQLYNGNSGAQIGAPNSVIWNVNGSKNLQVQFNIAANINLVAGNFIRVGYSNQYHC